jgi:alpha-L-fucosidase
MTKQHLIPLIPCLVAGFHLLAAMALPESSTAAGASPAAVVAAAPKALPETPAQYAARMKWWREARFGMFIHWDMSSVAGTEISWSRKATKPLDVSGHPAGYVEDPVYDNLYKKFNPVKFDAKSWVRAAQAAGMKYIVFTAKHHGGFCMWDTKLTDYSIMHTPFKRDVVKELSAACHEAGMKFGVYYSPRDWHHPDYGMGDNRKYVDYMNGQVRELLTNYGKIDIIWWDSYGRGDLLNFWRIGETFDLVKSLQPGIIMNNRMAVLAEYDRQPKPYLGDFGSPEQQIGGFQTERNWESCMCVVDAPGGGWSYRPDGHVKSFKECMRTLIGCAIGDGNLLLDVGPNPEGEIPAEQIERITQMGQWLAKYGVSVYGTSGGPWKPASWGGSTHRGGTVYLHLLARPAGDLVLSPIPGHAVVSAKLLGSAEAVPFQQTAARLTFSIPGKDPVADDLVVVLTTR